jgi:hypothetical protein
MTDKQSETYFDSLKCKRKQPQKPRSNLALSLSCAMRLAVLVLGAVVVYQLQVFFIQLGAYLLTGIYALSDAYNSERMHAFACSLRWLLPVCTLVCSWALCVIVKLEKRADNYGFFKVISYSYYIATTVGGLATIVWAQHCELPTNNFNWGFQLLLTYLSFLITAYVLAMRAEMRAVVSQAASDT